MFFFFPLGHTKHHVKKVSIKRIRLKDTNAKSNALAVHFLQTIMANGFLQPKVQDIPKVFVAPHHHFWKTPLRFFFKKDELDLFAVF